MNEGGSVSLNGTGSDPDGGTVTFVWDLDNNGTFETSGQNVTFDASLRDGPGSQTVVLKVCDDESTCTTSQGTVNILNVDPSIASVTNSGPVDEGSPATITVSATDPAGALDPLAYEFDCGDDGTYEVGPQAATSAQCTYPDGPNSHTVRVQVSDGDGGSDTGSTNVTVNNAPPTVVLSGPTTASEGQTKTYTYTVSDPGVDPNPTITEECGASGTYVDTPAADSFDCTFPDGPASSIVKVTADDGDTSNNIGSDQKTVEIANVAPTVVLSGPTTASEGQTKTYTYTVSDPGVDPNPTITEECGASGTYVDTPAADSFDCTFPDGPASSIVKVTADDGDTSNNIGSDQKTVEIANVAPVISSFACPLDPIAVGTAVVLSGAYSDAGSADTHTATIAWDDGSDSAATVNQSADSVSGTHTYTEAGIYTPELTVRDDDGGSNKKTCEYVVIYDPSAGFVTGGGWISSPAGAYAPNTAITGKATFGFVSKYRKGATTPEGNTEFQFHAASLNFKSTSYQWLVVSGSDRATFKGYGTINGAGNYGFLLSVKDGSPDLFRIKIWEVGGATVYDNQVTGDAGDSAVPTTALGGGSIVIHTGKSK